MIRRQSYKAVQLIVLILATGCGTYRDFAPNIPDDRVATLEREHFGLVHFYGIAYIYSVDTGEQVMPRLQTGIRLAPGPKRLTLFFCDYSHGITCEVGTYAHIAIAAEAGAAYSVKAEENGGMVTFIIKEKKTGREIGSAAKRIEKNPIPRDD